MSYNFKEYDQWRNALKCNICNEKHYRVGLCRSCYKKSRKEQFHCTHTNCVNPVFGATLCQKHYRSYRQRCLICHSRSVYYRHLCRTHYRQATKTGNFPVEPKCKCEGCATKVFVEGMCLKHFKEKYTDSECKINDCENKIFKRGLCCSCYFLERRKKEKEYINRN